MALPKLGALVFDLSSDKQLKRFSLSIEIDDDPVGKARHRMRVCGNRCIAYDGQKAIATQLKNTLIAKVKTLESEYIDFIQSCDFVEVKFIFCMPIVKSTSKKDASLMLQGILKPVKKPDIDNMIKMYLDAGNEILYTDDKLITKISAEKKYSNLGKIYMNLCYYRGVDD